MEARAGREFQWVTFAIAVDIEGPIAGGGLVAQVADKEGHAVLPTVQLIVGGQFDIPQAVAGELPLDIKFIAFSSIDGNTYSLVFVSIDVGHFHLELQTIGNT